MSTTTNLQSMNPAMRTIRSFIILDLETTGLKHEMPRITEIAMMAVNREQLIAASKSKDLFPRVFHNFNFCVNPEKTIERQAAAITALTNELLADEKTFDIGLFSIINHFIQRVPAPVCLVAHNGRGFDYPVLQAELARIGQAFSDDVLCADTLPAFREHIPLGSVTMPDETSKRFKMEMLASHQLKDLFQFLVATKTVRNLHSASGDVEILAKVIASQGDFFPTWADQHAISLNRIPKLW